jgi:type II secretory pathway component PulF
MVFIVSDKKLTRSVADSKQETILAQLVLFFSGLEIRLSPIVGFMATSPGGLLSGGGQGKVDSWSAVRTRNMSLTFTPGHFSSRAEFYHQLAQLTSAGLGVVSALERLQKHPPARSYRKPIGLLLGHVNAGNTIGESLRLQQWLPEFDVALIDAGERSGRMDASFLMLAHYYTERCRMARQFISDLMYPIVLLHFAIFVFPFAQFFLTGNTVDYAWQTIGLLVPAYLVVGVLIYLGQSRHAAAWRHFVERLLHPVPVLGAARRYLALGRLAGALEALISAGVNIFESWELAALASGSPSINREVRSWRSALQKGTTPSELVNGTRLFPDLFSSQYMAGEVSGKLDDCLKRLSRYYQEEGLRKMHAFAQWTPRLVYAIVAIMIGIRIVGFWSGYFRTLGNVLDNT